MFKSAQAISLVVADCHGFGCDSFVGPIAVQAAVHCCYHIVVSCRAWMEGGTLSCGVGGHRLPLARPQTKARWLPRLLLGQLVVLCEGFLVGCAWIVGVTASHNLDSMCEISVLFSTAQSVPPPPPPRASGKSACCCHGCCRSRSMLPRARGFAAGPPLSRRGRGTVARAHTSSGRCCPSRTRSWPSTCIG